VSPESSSSMAEFSFVATLLSRSKMAPSMSSIVDSTTSTIRDRSGSENIPGKINLYSSKLAAYLEYSIGSTIRTLYLEAVGSVSSTNTRPNNKDIEILGLLRALGHARRPGGTKIQKFSDKNTGYCLSI
jgi:hypothetical protein